MDIICDECGGSNIYVVGEKGDPNYTPPPPKKMTEIGNITAVPAVYVYTYLKCKDCGFTHHY